ncbi:hypothetical protein VTN31DRAFT_2103 [Thermomyces dupontii]|uniref:uncharacterized protein n=1 Tax=Talaromyces thermophilus TaxID=28565 RepID=UPI003742812C
MERSYCGIKGKIILAEIEERGQRFMVLTKSSEWSPTITRPKFRPLSWPGCSRSVLSRSWFEPRENLWQNMNPSDPAPR